MSFRPGDLVVVIRIPGVTYHPDTPPGTIATVEAKCHCPIALLFHPMYAIEAPTGVSVCAQDKVLRKIDGEGRQVVRWDEVPWRPEPARQTA